MSLHFVLDGYNITQQISALALKELKSSREGLARLLEIYRPQGSRQNKVTIVFDGKEGMVSLEQSPTVKIVFSKDESADDKIRKIVSASNRKKEMIVVTDDKELRFSVRALGAQVLGVKDFLAKATRGGSSILPSSKAKPKETDEKYISKTLEFKITSEFEKIWLKDK